ncbi:MAG: DUF1285 domain-containing protein [Beijerinckiaceae bacterium]|jgi:hypothetical protein
MTRDPEGGVIPPPLQNLTASLGAAKPRGPAPVEKWNPPFCGFIDLRIALDGTWFHAGTPILRPALVSLFASILRKDPDRYVLVTPVECVGITVDDVPFIATAMAREEGALVISTNLGDEVRTGAEHPLRFSFDATGGVKPYVHIRGGLWARFTRALALELIDQGISRENVSQDLEQANKEQFGIESGGVFFPIEPTAEEDRPHE